MRLRSKRPLIERSDANMTIAATVLWLRQQPWQLFWNIEMFSLSGCIAALTLYEANYTGAPSSEPHTRRYL